MTKTHVVVKTKPHVAVMTKGASQDVSGKEKAFSIGAG
jgi:hypothetical protein